MLCKLAIFTLLLCSCFSLRLLEQYSEFKSYQKEFDKHYSCVGEEFYRFMTYLKNLEKIERLNRSDQASGVYGLTRFTDLTKAEMFEMAGLRIPKNFIPRFTANFTNDPNYKPRTDVPSSWDWSQKGAVTSVKNQGSCGSCWSFSTAGNIQGQYFLKNKELVDFSEQQMVDCDVNNFGCSGGWPYNAIDFLSINGGLETSKSYPLRSNYSGPCEFDEAKSTAHIKGYMNVSQNQEIIRDALFETGPLSILLDFQGMMHYKGGVASPRFCGTWPNHALVLTGFGVSSKNEDYWLVKNSWGPKWGLSGYFMIKRGAKKCGIDHWAVTSILKE